MELKDVQDLYMRLSVAKLLIEHGPKYQPLATEVMKPLEEALAKLTKPAVAPPVAAAPIGPAVHEAGEEVKTNTYYGREQAATTPSSKPTSISGSAASDEPKVERRSE